MKDQKSLFLYLFIKQLSLLNINTCTLKLFNFQIIGEKGNKMCVLDIWYEYFLMNYRWKFFEAQPRFHMTHDECLRIGTRRERESDGEFYESFNSC